MKEQLFGAMVVIVALVASCKKDGMRDDINISLTKTGSIHNNKNNAILGQFNQSLPTIVKPMLPIGSIDLEITSRCIDSYEDLISVLGTNKVTIKSIILENGITINPIAEDIGQINYTAIEEKTNSSIFSSYLVAKWRPTPYDAWQGFTNYVWTTGCDSPDAGQIFYTNLIKGNTKLLINTSLTWNIGAYAGQNIQFLVIQ